MDIDDRLLRLERSVRRWKLVSCCIVIAFGVLIGCGDSQSTGRSGTQTNAAETNDANKVVQSIRARVIEVVNDRDVGIVRLGPNKDGAGGCIEILNSDGKPLVIVGAVTPKSAKVPSGYIVLKSQPADKLAVQIYENSYGGGSIDVHNALENIAASMTSLKTNAGAVTAHDFDGKPAKFLMGP